jgi:hypothetical protein
MDIYKNLMDKDKIMDCWPSGYQTPKENTESTIRFILYASLIVFLIMKDNRAVLIGALAIGFIYMNMKKDDVEDYVQETPPPQLPSQSPPQPIQVLDPSNPYGNRLLGDVSTGFKNTPPDPAQLQQYWDTISPGLEQKGARLNFNPVPDYINPFMNQPPQNCKTNPSLCSPDARGGGGQAARVHSGVKII